MSESARSKSEVSNRKRLLMGCAAAWTVAHLFPDYSCKRVLLIAEQVADGKASGNELQTAITQCQSYLYRMRLTEDSRAAADLAEWIFLSVKEPQGTLYQRLLRAAAEALARPGRETEFWLAHFHSLFEDITPQTVCFSPEWRTDTVLALAHTMYDTRDFSAMPILADALQDAGCDSEDVLNHCRGTAHTHVRGCWVVDLVLGKK